MLTTTAVAIDGLVKRYDGREVVDGVSLTAARGAVTAVLGPNGAGKTTTIECCEGLRRPDAGRCRVLDLDPQISAPALRPRVGVMLQSGGMPTAVRALEFLRHVAAMYARPWDVGELVERLGLQSFAQTTVRRLSGGQRQRLALACAVVGRPEVVFLDEPGAGMDPQSRHAVWDLIRELRADGVGVVLTTHLMDEAEALADQVYIVDGGKVIASGTTHELLIAGGSGAQVRIEAAAGLDVKQWAAALPGGSPLWTVAEREAGAYTVTGPVSAASLTVMLGWLAGQDVLASRVVVGQRTLEDVFLDLTGRYLR